MKKTGELLKKVREEKGLSLHEIGLSLKINPKILKQIEDGEKDNLPAKTFLRGFVQSYANYLKLDSDEVLRIFSEEMGSTKPQQIPTSTNFEAKSSMLTISEPKAEGAQGKNTQPSYAKKEFEFKNFGIGFLVILLLLSLIGVRKIVEKYQKESELETPKMTQEETNNSNPIPTAGTNSTTTPSDSVKPEDSSASEAAKQNPMLTTPELTNPPVIAPNSTSPSINTTSPTNQPQKPVTNVVPTTPSLPVAPSKPTTPATTIPSTAVITNSALPTNNSTKPASPPVVAPSTPTNAVNKTPSPTTTTPPQATTLQTKPTTTSEVTAEKPTTPPTTVKPEEPKKPKNVEVVIEALDSVDVEVTLSTGKSEVIKLSPSQTQTIKSAAGVKLNFSNGGAVNLIVNGKDIGIPGDLGKPKKVSF